MSTHSESHGLTSKLTLTVWAWLLILTGIEVFLAYIQFSVHVMLVLLMGLSLVKAALIMAYFMHLRFEKRTLVLDTDSSLGCGGIDALCVFPGQHPTVAYEALVGFRRNCV